MSELSKYQLVKMYLHINGYDSLKDLASDWNVTENGIRDYCRGKFTSPKLDRLTSQFIKDGDRKLQEHRKAGLDPNATKKKLAVVVQA